MDTFPTYIDGTIQSIHVTNFFCHENLFISFENSNKNVHSVMGNNGSGKSTIVSALVIGLGGRAATTYRGNNLQSFIKRDANTATIKIKLKNSGPQAYRHDFYGDSITVVRTINASGGSYKILNDSGKLVSKKASDVKSIVMAHDIQVDNPISVLNQDDARSFNGTIAKDKYAAFRRATNYEQTEKKYNIAQENCKKANVILARKIEAFRILTKEYNSCKMAYDQMKSQEEMENVKRQLQNELKWIDVARLELEAENANGECERRRSLSRKLAEELRKIEENHDHAAGTQESLRQRLASPTARRGVLELALREAEAEARRAAERSRIAANSRNQTRVRLKREQGQTENFAEAIRDAESGDDGGSRREALERAKAEALAAVEETTARRDTGRHEEEQAREHAARAASEAERAGAAVKADEEQLERARRELRELRQPSGDSLAVFGSLMMRLCERVSRAAGEGLFSAPPLGPVGKYLKVRNKEWAGALEHVIGNSINYFCVNTAEDSRRLFKIMDEVYGTARKPGVTCSAFRSRVHDVSDRRVSAHGGTCALDALEVTEPVVANYLIDNLELETVLLVPDHEDAVRLSDSAPNVPANCSKVVTRDCTEYMPAPRYRIYGGLERAPRYLGASTLELTRQMEQKIAELVSSVAEKSSEAAHLDRQLKTARRAHDRAARALHALQSALIERERAAEDAAEELQQHSTPQRAVLEEQYEICKANVTKLEEEMRELIDKEQSLEKKRTEADARVDEVRREFEALDAEYRSLQEEANQIQLKLEQSATEKTRHKRYVCEEAGRLQQSEVELEGRRKALSDEMKGLGERPAHLRARGEVESDLRKMERRLMAAQESAQTRQKVHAQLQLLTEQYKRRKEEIDAIQDLTDQISKLTEEHKKICFAVQTNIGRHVMIKFTNILKQRQYVGHIELNHAEGELDVYVNGRKESLSGGERSYSTVALFIAMWECVELPFYFMDEFDVFMDGETRLKAWELLGDFAMSRRGRLFVFLTQRGVPLDDRVTVVHRLDDPRK